MEHNIGISGLCLGKYIWITVHIKFVEKSRLQLSDTKLKPSSCIDLEMQRQLTGVVSVEFVLDYDWTFFAELLDCWNREWIEIDDIYDEPI